MYKAIIVDDEIWALRGMNNIIKWEEYGFEICSLCQSVEEALRAIDKFKPDIVFTDIRMPFMSGMDLLNKINDAELDTLTVIVSAYRDFDVAKQAIVKGVFAYLVKPLDKEEVIELAQRAKEKLDENKLSNGLNVTEIDLSDENNFKNTKVQQVLQETAIAPSCYLIVAASKEEAETIISCGISREIYISGYRAAYLYCGSLPADLMQKSDKIKVGDTLGISMKHNDFSEFVNMLSEARAAMEGGFIYSENKTIASIQFYLANEYMNKINLKEIAERFFLSEPYLYELFKKNTNMTAMVFIKNIRLNHAINLLKYTDDSIKDISEKVGYEDSGYFGRLFRKEMDCSPEAYRHKLRDGI